MNRQCPVLLSATTRRAHQRLPLIATVHMHARLPSRLPHTRAGMIGCISISVKTLTGEIPVFEAFEADKGGPME